MTNHLLAALIITLFSLLPGCWVIYALPLNGLRWYVRLALSVTLSPAILATQALLLKVFGIPFGTLAITLLIINLPAFMLLLRSYLRPQPITGQPVSAQRQASAQSMTSRQVPSSDRFTWQTLLGGGAACVLLVSYLAIPWRLVSDLRPFAWHALWHTDITYALTRNTLLPEEPELAGMRLAYGWFPHLFWSVTGWVTDLPPTILYAVTNVIWLFVAVALAYALCRDGLQLARPIAWLGTGMIFLGTNIAGAAAWLYARDWHWHKAYLGELRYTPMLGKYIGFETMPFAFALLLALILIATLALRRHIPQLAVLLTILLAALGLIYPILYPAGCLVVALFWLLLLRKSHVHSHFEMPTYTWREQIGMVIGGTISLVITFGFLQFIMVDGTNAPVHLSSVTAMQAKSIQVIVALLLFVPGLAYLGRSYFFGSRKTAGTVPAHQLMVGLFLAGSTLLLMLLYIGADLEALEYKFVLAATMVAAPLGAAGIAQLLQQFPVLQSSQVRWVVTLGILTGLFGVNQLLMLRVGAQVPDNLVNAPHIDEGSFWLALQPEQAEMGWVTAIQRATTPDTIVVTTASQIHVSPFLNRSLYAPSDVDGTVIAGYSVENRYNLLAWRGYAVADYDARVATINQLYGEQPEAWGVALQQMLTLQRPLAIHLQAGSGLHQWLQAQRLGKELYSAATAMSEVSEVPQVPQVPQVVEQDAGSNGTGDDHGTGDNVVWLVEPSATTLRTLEGVQEHARH